MSKKIVSEEVYCVVLIETKKSQFNTEGRVGLRESCFIIDKHIINF